MNDDFEEQLHDMLQERGATPLQTPHAPKKVLRRARRRQISTALVSGVTAVAVVGGAILGATALQANRGRPTVAENGPGSTRQVVFNGYGVTYPYDWALQSVFAGGPIGVDPGGLEQPATGDGTAGGDTAAGAKERLAGAFGPTLQLSNRYPDQLLDVECGAFPSTGVVFQVAVTPDAGDDASGGLEEQRTCDDGSVLYAQTARSGNLTFPALGRVGADATDADRQALFDAYDSIEYPSGDTGLIGGGSAGVVTSGPIAIAEEQTTAKSGGGGDSGDGPNAPTPPDAGPFVSTVVAGGTTDSGGHWVMTVDGNGTGGSIEYEGMGLGWSSAVSPDGEPAPLPDLDASVMPMGRDSIAVVSGSVVGAAESVEVRPDGGDPVDVELLSAPAVTGIDREYFLSELPDLPSKTGSVVALGAGGSTIGHVDYDLGNGNVSPGFPACEPPAPAEGGGDPAGDCPLPMPVCSPASNNPEVSGPERKCVPTCPEQPTNPENGTIECIAPPVVCPDEPVSSDGSDASGSTGGGTTSDGGDVSIGCTIVPPVCVEPVPEPTTGGGQEPATGGNKPAMDCPPPPTCVQQAGDGSGTDPGTDAPCVCVAPDPGTGTTAPPEDPNGSGGDSPPSVGCSFGGGADGNIGQEPVPDCPPQPGDVMCIATPEPAGTTGR